MTGPRLCLHQRPALPFAPAFPCILPLGHTLSQCAGFGIPLGPFQAVAGGSAASLARLASLAQCAARLYSKFVPHSVHIAIRESVTHDMIAQLPPATCHSNFSMHAPYRAQSLLKAAFSVWHKSYHAYCIHELTHSRSVWPSAACRLEKASVDASRILQYQMGNRA
jgi:hypothetical protein